MTASLAVEHRVFWRLFARHESPGEIRSLRKRPRMPSAISETIDGSIAGDRDEPRPEGGIAAKATESDVGLNEGVLNGVLGVDVRAHDGACGTVRRTIVSARQFVETRPGPLHARHHLRRAS